MTRPRLRRTFRAALALLFVALGAGVPIRAHAAHDGDGAHIGGPEHAHGIALVRQDMRSERPNLPLFTVMATATAIAPITQPRTFVHVPREEPSWQSRAPPTTRPRAPPA